LAHLFYDFADFGAAKAGDRQGTKRDKSARLVAAPANAKFVRCLAINLPARALFKGAPANTKVIRCLAVNPARAPVTGARACLLDSPSDLLCLWQQAALSSPPRAPVTGSRTFLLYSASSIALPALWGRVLILMVLAIQM